MAASSFKILGRGPTGGAVTVAGEGSRAEDHLHQVVRDLEEARLVGGAGGVEDGDCLLDQVGDVGQHIDHRVGPRVVDALGGHEDIGGAAPLPRRGLLLLQPEGRCALRDGRQLVLQFEASGSR